MHISNARQKRLAYAWNQCNDETDLQYADVRSATLLTSTHLALNRLATRQTTRPRLHELQPPMRHGAEFCASPLRIQISHIPYRYSTCRQVEIKSSTTSASIVHYAYPSLGVCVCMRLVVHGEGTLPMFCCTSCVRGIACRYQ